MTTEQIITILGIVLGSGGLWTLVTKLIDKRSEKKIAIKESIEALQKDINQLKEDVEKVAYSARGSSYELAKSLGDAYIKRGWISFDELKDYDEYLYKPYIKLNGDGTIEQLHAKLVALPIESTKTLSEV